MPLDKKIIIKNFSEAAETYNLWAKHQQAAATRLIQLLPPINTEAKILDAGCGTGLLTQTAYNRYNNAKFLGIDISEQMITYCRNRFKHIKNMDFEVNDLEKLNKTSLCSSFDLTLSSFTLQWIADIDQALKTLVNFLSPEGYLGIAVPIEGSIFELRDSFYNAFNTKMPGLCYKSPDDYIFTLKRLPVSINIFRIEDICIFFNGIDLLRYFRHTGTTFRHTPFHSSKTIKEINTLLKHYEKNYGYGKLLPLTFKILFLLAKKQDLTGEEKP